LNPALLREVAQLLMKLARHGFQIILATHSLFLLKEFHILAREQKHSVRYFGLSAEPGQATEVVMRDNLELLPNIVALDAELDQSDRFQAVLDQEDAD
jgi:predicted ATPase